MLNEKIMLDPIIAESITFAATLLAQLKRLKVLDDHDRADCERVQKMLEKAEAVLYGFSMPVVPPPRQNTHLNA